uniref:Uncharacterized protein n=2 Tax=Triticum urartu TaxID=4572 RepID=A0A8R7QW17_TRIUA
MRQAGTLDARQGGAALQGRQSLGHRVAGIVPPPPRLADAERREARSPRPCRRSAEPSSPGSSRRRSHAVHPEMDVALQMARVSAVGVGVIYGSIKIGILKGHYLLRCALLEKEDYALAVKEFEK